MHIPDIIQSLKMDMDKNNRVVGNYSEDTKNKLLFVCKKILSKAELSTSTIDLIWFEEKDVAIIWFEVKEDELKLSEYHLVIKKIESLWLIEILDEQYLEFNVTTLLYPIAYKLKVDISALRDLVNDLGEKSQNHTLDTDNVYWPIYYKWDKDGSNFEVADGKMFSFREANTYRWKVFDSLVKRKSKWVLVSTILKESGKEKNRDIHIIIDQLKKKINNQELGRYLKIDSLGKGQAGVPRSYRLIIPA